jgi:hypothetical protein
MKKFEIEVERVNGYCSCGYNGYVAFKITLLPESKQADDIKQGG